MTTLLTVGEIEDVQRLAHAAAKLGTWQRDRYGRLSCKRGDCVMGAVLRSRLSEEILEANVGLQWHKGINPSPELCAALLGIPLATAFLIAHANDGWYGGEAEREIEEARQLLLDILQPTIKPLDYTLS